MAELDWTNITLYFERPTETPMNHMRHYILSCWKNPWMNNQLIKQVIQEPGPCLGQGLVWFLILQTAREKGNQRSSAHVWIKDLHVSTHLLTILIIQNVHVAFIKARIQLLHIVSSIRMFSLNNFWKNKQQITSA